MTFLGRLAFACALTLTVLGLAQAQTATTEVTLPPAPDRVTLPPGPAWMTLPPLTTEVMLPPARVEVMLRPGPAEVADPLGPRVDVMAPAPPTMGWIVWRIVGALAVVGGLLTATLAMLRALTGGRGRRPAVLARGGPRSWLALWKRAGALAADRLEILDRRPVGARESVCVVRAGHEQFLIGVTASRVCLLGRLGPVLEVAEAAESFEAAGPRADVDEPTATDFARGLAESGAARSSPPGALPAESARSGPDEASFRLLLARSRDRLSRLGLDSVRAGAPRE